MIKYEDFLVLNEAKIDNIHQGDYVICEKNFRGVQQAAGKLAQIENIQVVEDETFFTLKFLKPDDPENKLKDWHWMVYHKYRYTDTITITKGQGRNLLKITPEEAKDFLRGNLVKMECTRPFGEILKELKFKVKNEYIDVCYLNVDKDKNDMVSFVPVAKYKTEMKGKHIPNPYEVNFRQSMKVSKIFKKLNPDLAEKDIEQLIPKYKIAWEKVIKNVKDNFQVVVGEDIRYWYHGKTYGKDDRGYQGDLGSSCMRHPRSQKRFDIYCENPDVCAMAILKNDKDELMARVLIWKLEDGGVYMDRIYSVDNVSYVKMVDYCKEQKMQGPWVRNQNGIKRVQVKRDYDVPQMNPFMDTFKYFNRKTFELLTTDAFNQDYKKGVFPYYNYVDHD